MKKCAARASLFTYSTRLKGVTWNCIVALSQSHHGPRPSWVPQTAVEVLQWESLHCHQLGTFNPLSPAVPRHVPLGYHDLRAFPASNPSPTLLAVTHCCPRERTEPQSQQLLLTPFTARNANTGGRPKRRWKAELFVKQAHRRTLERKICLRAARPGMPVHARAAFLREAGFLRGRETEPGREPRGKPAATLLSLIKRWLSPPTREPLLRSLFWQACSVEVNSAPCFVIWDDFKSLSAF